MRWMGYVRVTGENRHACYILFGNHEERRQLGCPQHTTVVPKVMSNFFLHANWEQQTKESAVVDGNSCCVILECLVTSIACIT